jgi:hypothetical protein
MNKAFENDNGLDTQARRAAERVGLLARRSRWRANTADNLGGFMVLDPKHNTVVHGARFDLTAQQVIDLCRGGRR